MTGILLDDEAQSLIGQGREIKNSKPRKEDIVHVRHYVVDLLRGGKGQDPARQERYLKWMGELGPPSTLLGVQALAAEALLYEIDVVCVVTHEVQHQA